jgi:hypothetical protein
MIEKIGLVQPVFCRMFGFGFKTLPRDHKHRITFIDLGLDSEVDQNTVWTVQTDVARRLLPQQLSRNEELIASLYRCHDLVAGHLDIVGELHYECIEGGFETCVHHRDIACTTIWCIRECNASLRAHTFTGIDHSIAPTCGAFHSLAP